MNRPRGEFHNALARTYKPFRRPLLWRGLWTLGIAVVVVVSLMPAPDLPKLPQGSDKLEHFLAYAVLAAGAVQLYAKRFALFSACVCLALLGLGLEYAQGALTSTRLRDGGDALANTLGVLVGLATQFTPWRDALLRFDTRR